LVWTEKALLKRLAKGPEERAKFVESQINNGIVFQIRALRAREGWSQPKLAREIETSQNQIYRLEKRATSKPTITTLKKIAAVFDVALFVRFVPFSQLIDWVSGTPFIDKGLSTSSLSVPSFAQETGISIGPGRIPDSINVSAHAVKGYLACMESGPAKPSAAAEINRQAPSA